MSLIVQYDFSTSSYTASNNTIANYAPIYNPSQYNGTVYNGATIGSSGVTKQSSSVLFNNVSQYIQIPGMQSPSDGLSFSFWFKSNNSANWARIFDFGNGSPNDNILVTINNNNLEFFVFKGTTSYLQTINLNINDNTWRHIVWTLSPSPNQWNIYINGKLTNTYTSGVYYPKSIFRNYQYINRSCWGPNSGLIGNIADFRIYNGAPLTSSQVMAIYNQDMTVSNTISGNNQMYNKIYCSPLFQTTSGFSQCQNCNYGNQTAISTTTQTTEDNCLKSCNTAPNCTSYNYNKNTNKCQLNASFPTDITTGIAGTNSGYSLTKFGYNYNNLSDAQRTTVQKQCALQYLDNNFTKGKNIDLSSCFSIPSGSNPTNFNLDPQCVYTAYSGATGVKPPVTINNSVYSDIGSGGFVTTAQTDTTIDSYGSLFNDYTTKQVAISNLNNKLQSSVSTTTANDSSYSSNITEKNSNLLQDFKTELADGKIEHFNNNDSNSKIFVLIFLVIIIIFLFYIFSKK